MLKIKHLPKKNLVMQPYIIYVNKIKYKINKLNIMIEIKECVYLKLHLTNNLGQ